MPLGTLAGFLPLGRAYLAEQFRHFRLDEVTRYLAASALLIRPVTVAMHALTEFERAWRGSSARARWTGRAPRRGSSARC
jgi:hypothetical protein